MAYYDALRKVKMAIANIDKIKVTRTHFRLSGGKSSSFSYDTLNEYDAETILADHRAVDCPLLASHARSIVDTCNAMLGKDDMGKIVRTRYSFFLQVK